MVFEKLTKKIGTSINTYQGEAFYIGTEIENKEGKFDDSYSTNQGFFLIHNGIYHHIYLVPFKHKNPRKSKLSVSEIEKNIDETENEYRFRLNNPSKYDESSFRYKKIKRGISLVIACEKGSFFHNKCIGSTESQSIRFSKEEFGYNISGKKKVVAWLQKHLRKFK